MWQSYGNTERGLDTVAKAALQVRSFLLSRKEKGLRASSSKTTAGSETGRYYLQSPTAKTSHISSRNRVSTVVVFIVLLAWSSSGLREL